MKDKIADFCLRWLLVFFCVAFAAFIGSGIAMHWCVIRALWRWL